MLSGKRIILGVTGGIAAYKAAFLLRDFQKAGAEVRVVMTAAATRFVGTDTFASLSGHEVAVDIFPESHTGNDWTRHINWGLWADLMVIAPCSANTLAKIAGGFSDNMLTATVLAARSPILICPTMDGEMYNAPATVQNLEKIRRFGYHVLEPDSGFLASGLEGKGRLPELQAILEKSAEIIGGIKGPLSGKKVLVTAGATREFIDPVRFISNPSTGKMGVAMAAAAQKLGAEVTLIHGAVSIPIPKNMHTESIVNAAELFEAVKRHSDTDIIIMAAAVSDFTPTETSSQKIKKEAAKDSISLARTQDILAWLGSSKKEGQTLIGFAMETQNLVENAEKKLNAKNLDWIVANALNDKESGFGTDTNSVELLGKSERRSFKGTKQEVADRVLAAIFPATE